MLLEEQPYSKIGSRFRRLNWTGMNFGRIVLQVKTQLLTRVEFSIWRHNFKTVAMKSATIRWVLKKCLLNSAQWPGWVGSLVKNPDSVPSQDLILASSYRTSFHATDFNLCRNFCLQM